MTNKERVFQIVSQIPQGKVATYGQIARMTDTGPRAVGRYLHKNEDPKTFPCHRVVHSDGSLAGGFAFGGKDEQLRLLESEGVVFQNGRINLKEFALVLI